LFIITDKASSKIKELLTKEQKTYGLRLGVMGGGCSGLQYMMEFDKRKDEDIAFQHNGAQVFIDPRSLPYLQGSQLDYIESLMGSGFKIQNPNEKDSCGCGHSFNV